MSKKNNNQVEYLQDEDYDEEDGWSEMSPDRSPYESDEDYDDRMSDLYGEDWNF